MQSDLSNFLYLSFYAVAQDACRTSRARLSKLKLTVEEKQLLLALPSDRDGLIERLKFIMEDREKRSKQPGWQQKTRQFFIRFSIFVDKTSCLVGTLLPQSPEYTISYGVIILIFKVPMSRRN